MDDHNFKHHTFAEGTCKWCNYRHRKSNWVTLALFGVGIMFSLAVFGFKNLLEFGLAIFFLGWGFMRLRESGLLKNALSAKDRNIPINEYPGKDKTKEEDINTR